MEALLAWLGALALAFVASGVGIGAMRFSRRLPKSSTTGWASLPASFLLNMPVYGIGLGAMGLAWKVASASGVVPGQLFPVVALAGWAACWARGLERYADDRLGSRTVATPMIEASLLPFGVLLLAGISIPSKHTVAESFLVAFCLLPCFLLYACWIFQKAYPDFSLDRKAVASEAFRHSAGFFGIGVAAFLLARFVPFLRSDIAMSPFFGFLGYFLGTWSEQSLRQRLNQSFEESQPMAVSQSLSQIAVPTSEHLPTVTVGRSTSQKP